MTEHETDGILQPEQSESPMNPEQNTAIEAEESDAAASVNDTAAFEADTAESENLMAKPQSEASPLPDVLAVSPEVTAEQARSARTSYIWMIVMVVLIVGFSIFCIIWDVKGGVSSSQGYYPAGDVNEVILVQQERPDADPILTNEDGTYTFEGIAAVVMSSIVELYVYADGVRYSTGSGIILSSNGYIATNAHVIDGGDEVTAISSDGTQYTAEIVGRDMKTDIAVLKVDATGLQAAVLGDSDSVRLGEQVCALGNPAGLTSSITTGIVSGLNRPVRADETNYEMDCIQTDAAISPGNSGGALVNLYGQVIGITSSKYSSSSIFEGNVYEGLGFAITINEALPIITELVEKGYVGGRVRIGIQFYENAIANKMAEGDLPLELQTIGILVTDIDPDSTLNDTIFKINDWIVEVEGQPVYDYDTLSAAIEGKRANESVHLRCAHVNEDGSVEYYNVDFTLLEDRSGNY